MATDWRVYGKDTVMSKLDRSELPGFFRKTLVVGPNEAALIVKDGRMQGVVTQTKQVAMNLWENLTQVFRGGMDIEVYFVDTTPFDAHLFLGTSHKGADNESVTGRGGVSEGGTSKGGRALDATATSGEFAGAHVERDISDITIMALSSDREVINGECVFRFSVLPEDASYLTGLMKGGTALATWDLVDAIKSELLAKVLLPRIAAHPAADFRGNRALLASLETDVRQELTRSFNTWGLALESFIINWGLTEADLAELDRKRQTREEEALAFTHGRRLSEMQRGLEIDRARLNNLQEFKVAEVKGDEQRTAAKRWMPRILALSGIVVVGIIVALIISNGSRPASNAPAAVSSVTTQAPKTSSAPESKAVPKYTVAVSVSPAGAGTVSPGGGSYSSGDKITFVATASPGYQFSAWSGSAYGSDPSVTVSVEGDRSITAIFAPIRPTLTTSMQPPGGGSVSPSTVTVDYHQTVVVTATPSSGYRFGHWEGTNSATANPSSVVLDSNKTIVAYFTNVYKLSVSANPTAYTITISPNAGVFDAGTPVKLTATLLFPYAFKSWTGADKNDMNPTTVTMNGDANISLNVVQCVNGDTKTASGHLAQNMGTVPTTSIQIQLNIGEWVQGQIIAGTSPLVYANIKDPNGNTVKDFGAPGQANFTFSAQVTGPYTVTFQNKTIWDATYSLSYSIYHIP